MFYSEIICKVLIKASFRCVIIQIIIMSLYTSLFVCFLIVFDIRGVRRFGGLGSSSSEKSINSYPPKNKINN